MVKILKRCGYYVANESGKQNFKINIADLVMFSIYFVLSIVNLFSSNPSILMFALNAISIIRLIFKNYMEQSKMVEKYSANDGYNPMKITMVHMIKIAGEVSSFVLLLIFICWSKINGGSYDAVKLMAFIVLVVNWIENLIGMFERLYDARPIPLQLCNANNL